MDYDWNASCQKGRELVSRMRVTIDGSRRLLQHVDPAVVYRGDRVFIYVNKRPINYARSDLKEMISLARNRLRQILGSADDGK